jgi:hypothetical protein
MYKIESKSIVPRKTGLFRIAQFRNCLGGKKYGDAGTSIPLHWCVWWMCTGDKLWLYGFSIAGIVVRP